MKKLSIEAKAKRYDEAIEKANSLWRYKNQPCIIDVSEIFPELKENEDESIRKLLIGWINLEPSTSFNDTFDGFSKEQIIAWLEKQIDDKDIHLLELKAKAYDDSKERMSRAYDANRVPLSFANEIFPNLNLYKNQDEQKPDNIDSKAKTQTSEYCYVLDYNSSKVFKHCITEDEVNLNTEELLKKYGLNEDECSIMYASNNLELELLKD